MMKLAVLAVEQAWASTTASPAASPAPCYKARLLTGLFDRQNFRHGFARLYLPLSGSAGVKQHRTKWTIG
jgi:hypothetical protein